MEDELRKENELNTILRQEIENAQNELDSNQQEAHELIGESESLKEEINQTESKHKKRVEALK